MKLLMIGGTRFLGRHVVDAALARGHAVTLFHRGATRPDLFPECERILGDRERDLARLDGRTWDAVVDTCGFVPRVVDEMVSRLAPRIGHYTFVSSISVYPLPVAPGADETTPVQPLDDPAVETVSAGSYGPLKAACERVAEERLPGRVLSARAGLLVGPWDYTDRFGYWVGRFAEGGDVLVPDAADQPLQIVDARDAAAWLVTAAERGTAGTFHLTGPAEPLTLGACFDAIERTVGPSARRVPVPAEFLAAEQVSPWSEIPLWAPQVGGFLSVRIERAVAEGLTFRPIDETIRDVRDWLRSGERVPDSGILATPPPASLKRERERELLAAWRARTP